jgi:bromodomain-containing protein 8
MRLDRFILGPSKVEGEPWVASALNLLNDLLSHRYGAVFANPVNEADAPDYYKIIRKPMDLSLIKQRIKEQVLNNIDEIERDVYLVFQNAIMYNNEDSEYAKVYAMAVEMKRFAEEKFRVFRLNEEEATPKKKRRR